MHLIQRATVSSPCSPSIAVPLDRKSAINNSLNYRFKRASRPWTPDPLTKSFRLSRPLTRPHITFSSCRENQPGFHDHRHVVNTVTWPPYKIIPDFMIVVTARFPAGEKINTDFMTIDTSSPRPPDPLTKSTRISWPSIRRHGTLSRWIKNQPQITP